MQKILLKILILPLSIIYITSCKGVYRFAQNTPFSPTLAMAGIKVPEGTPKFQQGWKDGCSTGYHARGNGFYRSFHKIKQNSKLFMDPEYEFGHQRGYGFCYTKALSHLNSGTGWDDYLFARSKAWEAKSWNSTPPFWEDWNSISPFNNPSSNGGPLGSASGKSSGMALRAIAPGEGKGVLGSFDGSGTHPLWAGGMDGHFFDF